MSLLIYLFSSLSARFLTFTFSSFSCLSTLLDSTEFALPSGIVLKKTFSLKLLSLGSSVLLLRNNTSPFVHHKLISGQKTFGFVGSSVPNLLTRTKKFLKCLSIDMVFSICVSHWSFHLIY